MDYIEIFLISLGVAMDAFTVSICKGISLQKINIKKAIKIGLYFGVFQAIMPLIGYFLGSSFSFYIEKIDHWVTFILLFGIGLNMIKESFDKEKKIINKKENEDISFITMILLSIATSIDAFAIGITFACLNTNISLSVSVIGIITFILSVLGVIIGKKFGNIFENKAEIIGGIILCFIGIKILLEHLNVFYNIF